MFIVLVIGLGIGMLAYILLQALSTFLVDTVYMSEENRQERLEGYVEDLQEYVSDNKLTIEDNRAFAEWAKRNRYVYLMIYNGGQLFFESGEAPLPDKEPEGSGSGSDGTDTENPGGTVGGTDTENPGGTGDGTDTENPGGTGGGTDTENPGGADGGSTDTENPNDSDNTGGGGGSGGAGGKDDTSYGSGITVRFPSKEELVAYAEANAFQDIHTADGGTLMVKMGDFSEYLVYDIGNIVSVFVGVLLVFIIIMLYFYRVVSRITKVAEDVKIVAGGDTEHRVSASRGNDEITMLSDNVEQMRTSILENIEKERAAMNANAELITAMSHDIRTPLTVLLGYMDIMKSDDVDRETMKEYVQASEKTVLRLKKMSDDLFNYFLLFGSGADEINLMPYEADMLFGQMLSEYILLLRERGYEVNMTLEMEKETKVTTDPDHLMRIIENVFSNIFKYADKMAPVSITVAHTNGKIKLMFTNTIAKEPTGAESTGIGIRTSEKIAEALGIEFVAGASGDFYSVTLIFTDKEDN